MRWELPQHGDIRTITCFLFFPKCIDGEIRWLEIASWQERYNNIFGEDTWESHRWVDS